MATDSNLEMGLRPSATLRDLLVARGFVPDGAVYRRGDLAFSGAGRWYRLREAAITCHDFPWPLAPVEVALWKWVQQGSHAQRVFEIPSWAVRTEPEDSYRDTDDRVPLGPCLDWALATCGGRVPDSWQPPARDLVESWLPQGALTVQADAHVRQGDLILQPDQWTLRIPLLPEVSAALPEDRRLALVELARDAQSLWAMLRLALVETAGNRALVAEVDLTGAPPSELLFAAGLDVLRQATVRLIETAEALADVSLPLASLSVHCSQTPTPTERIPP